MYIYTHTCTTHIHIQGLTPFRRPLFRPLEAFWGPHEWLLELSRGGLWGSRGRLGASWGLLGDLGVVLGSHGAAVGVLLGPSWGFLGPSWDPLGLFLGLLEGLLGPL